MALVYHLLDEREAFSERDGGAISRWAANVLREGSEVVICPSFDYTWDFPIERIYQLPQWKRLGPVHPVLYRMPWSLQKIICRKVFQILLKRLNKGDVVYVHNRPAYAAVLATVAQRHGFQVVLHMHNSHLSRANSGQIHALRRVPIVFCSEFLRREANTALPNHFERTYVVHNGADARKFRSTDRSHNSTPTIIFTGRTVPYKGVHILLEAMRLLEVNGINAVCKVVGGARFGSNRSTPYMKKLQRLRPNNTELVGYKIGDSIAELLRNADIFCCPSIWNDPFPLAPLEAMATGLPIVASNVGGIPEAVAYGGGILVPPNDASALANALGELVNDKSHREEMGKVAQESCRCHFLWANVRLQYEQVLQEVTA